MAQSSQSVEPPQNPGRFSLTAAAQSANYPERPVTIVVGFAPGGASDGVARLLARKLSERLGQQFVVQNKPGAATRIGMEAVQKAQPNGYTIGIATAVTTTFPLLFEGMTFEPNRDFAPITMLGRAPTFLAIRQDLPARDFHELVAYAKKSGLTFGHPGNGSNPQIAGMALARAAGISLIPVAYRGTQPAATALAAGEVDAALLEYQTLRPMLEARRIRLLAVTEPQRSLLRPEVPTGIEAGLTQQVEGLTPWLMMIAPAETPQQILNVLNVQLREVLAMPEVLDQMKDLGVVPESGSSGQAATYFTEQRTRIAHLVKELQLSVRN